MKMRSLYLGAVAAGSLGFAAHAADVDAKGAADLVKAMTALLPEKAVATGFIQATPDKDHYRVSVDLGRLVHGMIPAKEFDLSAAYETLVYPPKEPDGLMTVKRDSSDLTISAHWDKGPEKGNLSYLIRDFVFDGELDPAIYYFRNMKAHASGGTMASDDGKQKLDASFGPSDQTMSSARNADGSVDINANGLVSGLRENVSGQGMPGFSVGMGGLTVDASVKALKVTEIAGLVRFVMDHAKDENLKPDDKKAFADLARKALPLFGGVEEKLSFDNITGEGEGAGVKIDKASYSFGMDGLVDNSAIRFGLSMTNPQVTGVPQVVMYGDLMPKELTLSVSIPELNFASAANAFFDQADFAKAEPLTKEQSDAIGRIFLKDHKLKVAVPEFSARSAIYDVSVTGSMSVDVDAQPTKAEAVFDVTAKNIDATIKGIQELGQKVPDLNTASFVMMMAKGIAKNDPDGTSHWKVEVGADGTVKVNGQVMPH